jgi:hypothetical protein
VDNLETIAAAKELLDTTKRNLQLVDAQLARLRDGRSAVMTAHDVSSEHRPYFIGAIDDNDGLNGIALRQPPTIRKGFDNPYTGTLRNQEDAAFVCTDVLVAVGEGTMVPGNLRPFREMFEDWVNTLDFDPIPYLRLTDGNTGRNLITGMTVDPLDRDRGALPFSYFTSVRPGLGSNIKNRLFSEFTIPRAGTVKAEVFDLSPGASGGVLLPAATRPRVCVTLLGFKVYGG